MKKLHPSAENFKETKEISSVDDNKLKSFDRKLLKILVVDDNQESAQVLQAMLEEFGHEAFLSTSTASALKMAAEYAPDVLFLDLGMPEMNGYQLCLELKQLKAIEDSLFIAQTGWGAPEHHESSLQAGFDYHLVKPLQMDTLEKILAAFIASRASES